MPDPEIDSERSSPPSSSEAGSTALMKELARVSPVPGALREVVLPTPLRGLVPDAAAKANVEMPELGAVVDGRYRLESVLGSGGMGVVFAAYHLQTDKPVALKWLSLSRGQRGSRDRAQALARFAREARAAGRIRHPNVIDVYDASSDERAPYLVMERLEGETLRARIERAPLRWEEMLGLLVPAMRGVAELHRQGIVHRDLKPDNVFLARLPESAQPCAKVLDFGVSLLRSVDALEDSLTGTGAIVGTPSYMPLEQLRGADNVDERTDVYALGVVLFEALSGRRPWQARSAGEYGALLASTKPTRLATLKPELKGAREAAIMKALEREPGDRHQCVEAFIAALEEASRPPSRTWRFALVALGVGLSLAALAAQRGWQAQSTSTATREAAHAKPLAAPVADALDPPAREAQTSVTDPASARVAPPVSDPTITLPPASRPPTRAARAPLSVRALRSKASNVAEKVDRLEPPIAAPTAPPVHPVKDYATDLARDDF